MNFKTFKLNLGYMGCFSYGWGFGQPQADSSKTEKDIFILKRTRVPNREAAFRFQHSKVNSKEIRRKLDDMPVKQNHFWRYANQRLQFFRGTKAKHLFQHLKEVEFRYNSKDKNLFEILVAKIARF